MREKFQGKKTQINITLSKLSENVGEPPSKKDNFATKCDKCVFSVSETNLWLRTK